MSFWDKVKKSIAGVGIGTEVTLFIAGSADVWKWVAALTTLLAYWIGIWAEDKNNDGIVDGLEEKDNPNTNEQT